MDKLIVEHAFSDTGNCREYFWVKEIHLEGKEPTHPKRLLVCSQDEGPRYGGVQWYRATNDSCWYEPESPIRKSFRILSVDGQVLREPITDEGESA